MKILSPAILIASVPLSTASAQFELGKDASYFCTVEAVGGLAYNERTKKWEGTSFIADDKFVLRLKFLRTRTEKAAFDRDSMVHDYIVTVTKSGTNFASPCNFDSSITEQAVTVWDEAGVVACE